MAKAMITDELIGLIRSIRIENRVTAKALAAHIGKSASYITKLEHGSIQSISESDLFEMLRFILGDKADKDAIIESVFESLTIKYSAKEIENQLWFYNFDTVIRTIPVPESFCNDIQQILGEHSIALSYLVKRINQNEFIAPEIANNKSLPENEWLSCTTDDKVEYCIRMHVSEEDISAILSRTITNSSYIILRAIALYSIKISAYGEAVNISAEQTHSLNERAMELLSKHKVYSLTEKQKLIEIAKTRSEQEALLSKSDYENISAVNSLFEVISLYSDFNVGLANEQLKSFTENLKWDAPFIMRIAALSFDKLSPCSYRIKKALLNEIRGLLEKYMAIPESERTTEEY